MIENRKSIIMIDYFLMPHTCFNNNKNNNIETKQMSIVKKINITSFPLSKNDDQHHHNTNSEQITILALNPFLEVDIHLMVDHTMNVMFALAMCA